MTDYTKKDYHLSEPVDVVDSEKIEQPILGLSPWPEKEFDFESAWETVQKVIAEDEEEEYKDVNGLTETLNGILKQCETLKVTIKEIELNIDKINDFKNKYFV
jgi:hypothetical protein